MKRLLLFSYLLLFSLLAQASPLAPNEPAALIDHLIEINAEWEQQALDWPELQEKVVFETDVQRIQTHLKWVERILRQKTSPTKGKAAQQRAQLLDVLNQYWKRGLFPKNTQHKHRQPYFIDRYGTACAVGYLIQQSGGAAFTARVAEENNYAYIRELNYPELPHWADKHGFTLAELAWIQPGYSPAAYNWTEQANNINDRVEVLLSDTLSGLVYAAGAFDTLGSMANCGSVVAWDGQDWSKLGDGVDGEIYALEIHDGELIAAGAFALNGQEVNIARWDGSAWQPMQTGAMNGSIEALASYDCALYVGGDFMQIGNLNHPYFALWDGTSWNMHGNSCTLSPPFIPEDMLLDGPVKDFAINTGPQGGLYVGGAFTAATSNGQTYSSPGLIRWNRYFWEFSQQELDANVIAVAVHDNQVFATGADSLLRYLKYYDLGMAQWFSIPIDGESLDFEFFHGPNGLYAAGGFKIYPLIGYSGRGLMQVAPYANGLADINAPVSAAAFFEGELWLAGSLDTIRGNTMGPAQQTASFSTPGPFRIVSTDLMPVSTQTPEAEAFVQLRQYDGSNWLHFDVVREKASLRLLDLNGRVLAEQLIPRGAERQQLELPQAGKGLYIYELMLDGERHAGRFIQ